MNLSHVKGLSILILAAAFLGCNDTQPVVNRSATTSSSDEIAYGDRGKMLPTKSENPKTEPGASAVSAPSVQTESVSTDARTGKSPYRVNQLKDLAKVDIKINGHVVHCWLMDTESKRSEGMMFLTDKDVRNDEGMIFVFANVEPNDSGHGFWMHNCPLGLDIAFITPSKRVANVADGLPFRETSVYAAAPYQYVLEMKSKRARNIGAKPGVKVVIPASVKSADGL